MKDAANPTMTITKTVYLKASLETVWDHLTKKDKLGVWFHPAAADLEDGAAYSLLGADGAEVCWGKVLRIEPPRRLVYSFTIKPLGGLMTEVEWTLSPVDGGVRLSLVHSGLPEGEAGFGLLSALDAGWDEHVSKLRSI